MNLLYNLQPSFTGVMALVALILVAIVHVMFAVAVKRDGDMICAKGGSTLFVSPVIWSLATLMGGVWAAVGYWAMHHSTLRPN